MFLSFQLKRLINKIVYFHILHTCLKSHQPRGKNKKAMANTSPISNSIGCYEKIEKITFKVIT